MLSGWIALSGLAGALAEPTVSVRVPDAPARLVAVISAVPSDLATATQKVSTCSTATISGALEVTVYSAPLGPMMRPLRSPTSRALPL